MGKQLSSSVFSYHYACVARRVVYFNDKTLIYSFFFHFHYDSIFFVRYIFETKQSSAAIVGVPNKKNYVGSEF